MQMPLWVSFFLVPVPDTCWVVFADADLGFLCSTSTPYMFYNSAYSGILYSTTQE